MTSSRSHSFEGQQWSFFRKFRGNPFCTTERGKFFSIFVLDFMAKYFSSDLLLHNFIIARCYCLPIFLLLHFLANHFLALITFNYFRILMKTTFHQSQNYSSKASSKVSIKRNKNVALMRFHRAIKVISLNSSQI